MKANRFFFNCPWTNKKMFQNQPVCQDRLKYILTHFSCKNQYLSWQFYDFCGKLYRLETAVILRLKKQYAHRSDTSSCGNLQLISWNRLLSIPKEIHTPQKWLILQTKVLTRRRYAVNWVRWKIRDSFCLALSTPRDSASSTHLTLATRNVQHSWTESFASHYLFHCHSKPACTKKAWFFMDCMNCWTRTSGPVREMGQDFKIRLLQGNWEACSSLLIQ